MVFNRFQFWDYQRPESQLFDEYMIQLKELAGKCDFAEVDNMIRDKIVFSTHETALKERILREKNPDLKKVVEYSKAAEVTKRELKSMKDAQGARSQAKTAQVDAIRSKNHRDRVKKSHGPQSTASEYQGQSSSSDKDTRPRETFCTRCGSNSHTSYSQFCPAWGQTCNICTGKDHYAKMCRARRSKRVQEVQVEENSEESEVESVDEFFIATVETMQSMNAWFTNVQVAGSTIKMKVDSGAETNVIPTKTWYKTVNRPKLKMNRTKLRAFGNTEIPHEGVATVPISIGEAKVEADVFVTTGKTIPILGLKACVALGLLRQGENAQIDSIARANPITMDTLKSEYKDVFSGLGKYKSNYHIELKENAVPTIQPPRRVSPKLNEPLKEKLNQMEKAGIIKAVDKPTEWVNSLVIAEKKDRSLQVCLDPKSLNENIKRETFQIPTFQDIVTRLGGTKIFTILDQKDSYWQVELDDASAELCTFGTPFGRYMFKRMPFGISSASEIQQKKTYQVFGDIQGVHIVADDMLIAAENEQEHDAILTKVLERAREEGVKFNLKKTQPKREEVLYMGVRVGADGLKPDEAKKSVIVEMPNPVDKVGVQRFIGNAELSLAIHSNQVLNYSTTAQPYESRSTLALGS